MTTPLLLIHGALGDAAQMTPLAALLATKRPIHVVELEGHGKTPATASRYSIERFADNIRDFMAARGIARAAIAGYSMGGYAGLWLAANSPELVTSVATLGTKLAWTPDVATRETGRLQPATIRAKVPKFADLLEKRHVGAGGWELVLERTAALMTDLGQTPRIDAAMLARITVPVRLMVGDRDTLVTIDEAASAARGLTSGELCVLPATPHPIEQVRPAFVAALLDDFFA